MDKEKDPFARWSFYDLGNQLLLHISEQLNCRLQRADAEKEGIVANRDKNALEQYKLKVRSAFLDAIGNPAVLQAGPVTACGQIKTKALEIKKILYTTEQKTVVPALIYKAREQKGKCPGILFLCGHEKDGKQNARYQEICQLLAIHGFVVLCPEIAGQGERLEAALMPTSAHNAAGIAAMAAGKSLATYLVHEAMTAVSVLSNLPEVDGSKIAVTGNSGGGLQSMMLALADTRVQAVAAGTFLSSQWSIFCSGKPQDAEQVWHNTLLEDVFVDHDDLLWAFSPKPMMVLGAEDDFFPFEGLLKTIQSAKGAYALQHAQERLKMYSENVSHQYTQGMARAAAAFFARQFSVQAPVPSAPVKVVAPQMLWCTPGGSVALNFPKSKTLKSCCVPATLQMNPEMVAAAVSPLTEKGMSRVKHVDRFAWESLECSRLMYAVGNGLYGVLCMIKKPGSVSNDQCDLFLWEGGTQRCLEHKDEITKCCQAGRIAVVCDLIAMGAAKPQPVNGAPLAGPFGTLYHLNCWLMRMGGSLAALRTAGLINAVRYLQKEAGLAVTLHADNPYWLYGLYMGFSGQPIKMAGNQAERVSWLAAQLDLAEPDSDLWLHLIPGILAAKQ